MRRNILWLGLLSLAMSGAHARDGAYFTSFGDQGRERLGFSPDLDVSSGFVNFVGLAVQPDGRILVSATVANGASDDFGLLRLLPNGTLDTTFGDQGQVLIPFDLGGLDLDVASHVLLQPNGRIVQCGAAEGDPAAGGKDFAFSRVTAAGAPDTSFSGDGKATVAFDIGPQDERDDEVVRCLLQPDGKIVAAGWATVAADTPRMAVTRLNSDGSRDTGFNGNGTATVDFGASFAQSRAFGVRLQPDGSLLLAGLAAGSGGSRWALARLDPSGQIDAGFGNGGIVLFDPEITGYAPVQVLDLLVRDDGSFVAVGALLVEPSTTNFDFGVFAFDADGSPDAAFGTGGGIAIPFDLGGPLAELAVTLVEDPQGRLVVTGFGAVSDSAYTIVMARLSAGGQLDPAFGNSGKLAVSTAAPADVDLGDQGTAMAFAPDSGLLVASLASTPDGTRAGIAKLIADTVFEDGFDP
jgi:uncharacterized delta-60 repeat protein